MNEEHRLKYFEKVWEGKNESDLFPFYLRGDFPVGFAQKGHCLKRDCAEELSQDEMRRKWKDPRPFCSACWSALVNTDIINCIISKDRLPQGKVVAQKKYPEDISNYVCDGRTRDYYTLLCNIVLGNVEIIGDSVIRFVRSVPAPPAFDLLEDFLSEDETLEGPDIDDMDLIMRQIRRLYPGYPTTQEEIDLNEQHYMWQRDMYLQTRREGECFLEWDFRRQNAQIKEIRAGLDKEIEGLRAAAHHKQDWWYETVKDLLSHNFNPDTEGLTFGDKLKTATYYTLKTKEKGW